MDNRDFQQATSDLAEKCFKCQKDETEHNAIVKIVKWAEEFGKELMGLNDE